MPIIDHDLPDELEPRDFSVRRKGFDQDEVRAYLIKVDAQYREMALRAQDAKVRLEQAEYEIAKFKEQQDHSVDSAIASVLEAKDRILDRARKQAAQIEEEARQNAELAAAGGGEAAELLGEARVRAAEILRNAERQAAEMADVRARDDELIANLTAERDRLHEKVERLEAATATAAGDPVAVAEAQEKAKEIIASAESAAASISDRLHRELAESTATLADAEEQASQIIADAELKAKAMVELAETSQPTGEGEPSADTEALVAEAEELREKVTALEAEANQLRDEAEKAKIAAGEALAKAESASTEGDIEELDALRQELETVRAAAAASLVEAETARDEALAAVQEATAEADERAAQLEEQQRRVEELEAQAAQAEGEAAEALETARGNAEALRQEAIEFRDEAKAKKEEADTLLAEAAEAKAAAEAMLAEAEEASALADETDDEGAEERAAAAAELEEAIAERSAALAAVEAQIAEFEERAEEQRSTLEEEVAAMAAAKAAAEEELESTRAEVDELRATATAEVEALQAQLEEQAAQDAEAIEDAESRAELIIADAESKAAEILAAAESAAAEVEAIAPPEVGDVAEIEKDDDEGLDGFAAAWAPLDEQEVGEEADAEVEPVVAADVISEVEGERSEVEEADGAVVGAEADDAAPARAEMTEEEIEATLREKAAALGLALDDDEPQTTEDDLADTPVAGEEATDQADESNDQELVASATEDHADADLYVVPVPEAQEPEVVDPAASVGSPVADADTIEAIRREALAALKAARTDDDWSAPRSAELTAESTHAAETAVTEPEPTVAANTLDYSPSVPYPDPMDEAVEEPTALSVADDEDEPIDEEVESRYSRNSAKLPRLGIDPSTASSSIANLRKHVREG